MSRFNATSTGTKTVNLAGGEAYSQSPELELVSILLTSFANDQYYRSANDTFDQIKTLVDKCDPLFVAKAAVYARTEFGMRSISHVVASEVAKNLGGKHWAKKFYDAIIYRPDDMTEILSYHKSKNGKIPNSMKKGFAKAFDKFDRYQLAKYKGEGKAFKLIDVVNLVHPTPSERNAQALKDLVDGNLKSEGTWEAGLTKAGQGVETEEEKSRNKAKVWADLINERKIGYFALLRNLRNIIEQSPESIDKALELLTDERLIKKSLVLPFRYLTAMQEIQKIGGANNILVALNKALDISCNNVPKFEGNTLVVCDYSGSMGTGAGSYRFKGSLFGSILAKANNADFMIFGDDSAYLSYNPNDSTLTINSQFCSNNDGGWGYQGRGVQVGHGTNFHSIFQKANKAYDRIVIFSDMQGWKGYYSPESSANQYRKQHNINTHIYSIDLAGHGTMQFPENNVYCLAGFSEKMFDAMKLLEEDRNALVNKIKGVEI